MHRPTTLLTERDLFNARLEMLQALAGESHLVPREPPADDRPTAKPTSPPVWDALLLGLASR